MATKSRDRAVPPRWSREWAVRSVEVVAEACPIASVVCHKYIDYGTTAEAREKLEIANCDFKVAPSVSGGSITAAQWAVAEAQLWVPI